MSLPTKRIFTSRRFYKNVLPIALGSYFITKWSKKLHHKLRKITSTPNEQSKDQKKIDFKRDKLSTNIMDKVVANRWKELMKAKEDWKRRPIVMNSNNFRLKLKESQRLRTMADKGSPKVSPRPLHTDYLVLTTKAPSSPLLKRRPPSPLPLRPHSPVETRTPLLEKRPPSPLPLRSQSPIHESPIPLLTKYKNTPINGDVPTP